jgi:hypothetical protein
MYKYVVSQQKDVRCTIKKLLIICALVIAPVLYAEAQASVNFHGFPWGTSIQEFTAKIGNPAYEEYDNELRTLVYDDITVSGYPVFMVVYFSQNGLEGGTYYFDTSSFDELMRCYTNVQKELLERYGSTNRRDEIGREMRSYETIWDMPSGFVHLQVYTRTNEPVTLWYSSPALTRRLLGQ